MRIANNMTELVGNTPLVRLGAAAAGCRAEVIAKLEFFNPTSSVKDRAALFMIYDAEKTGRLKPGAVIVEPTSGNTGIGLAFVSSVRGYRLILTMPENMSEERKTLLRGMGAELVLTPASLGMAGAIAEAKRIVGSTENSLILAQFDNPANPAAHYATTAEEIWRDTGGRLDILVCSAGTGGTLTGTARRLKEYDPRIKAYAAEPSESAVLSGGEPHPHGIQGIGPGFVPDILDRSLIDGVIAVSSGDAVATAKKLIEREGILCGISSGASAHAALSLARNPQNAGKRIVFIVHDTAERYLSTELFKSDDREDDANDRT